MADDGDQHLGGEAEDGGEGGRGGGEGHDLLPKDQEGNQESVDGEFGLFPMIKGFKQRKIATRPPHLILMKYI